MSNQLIQIHGGMGLMDDLPLERLWRDAKRIDVGIEGVDPNPSPAIASVEDEEINSAINSDEDEDEDNGSADPTA